MAVNVFRSATSQWGQYRPKSRVVGVFGGRAGLQLDDRCSFADRVYALWIHRPCVVGHNHDMVMENGLGAQSPRGIG